MKKTLIVILVINLICSIIALFVFFLNKPSFLGNLCIVVSISGALFMGGYLLFKTPKSDPEREFDECVSEIKRSIFKDYNGDYKGEKQIDNTISEASKLIESFKSWVETDLKNALNNKNIRKVDWF